ncbi:MAG TPA: FapA family protein [Planctomycetota bacterium]|nr:FapA family protein [Planctomycetota bacterium]
MDLIKKAETLLGSAESRFENGVVISVEELLRRAITVETDVARIRRLSLLLSEFAGFHRSEPEGADADSIRIDDETPFEARVTLLAGRRSRRLTPDQFLQILRERGIVHGIREAVVVGACACAGRSETVYRLLVASGDSGEPGEDGSVSFAVKAFDKRLLLDPEQPFFGDLSALVEDVKPGTLVARLVHATAGRPGHDIRGGQPPAVAGKPIGLGIGEGLQIYGEGRDLRSLVRGSLVVGEETLDLVPFQVVDGHLGLGQDIAFEGNVVVSGHVTGPVRIQARDIYIAGNVENAQLSASGDVWVGGTIQGKSSVEAEGRVLARSVSDSAVRAIGDIVVADSVIESRVTSSGRVLTRPSTGVIEGGEVSGFRGVLAHTLGSSYGLTTKVKVGVEDLRSPLLAAIDKRIHEHEESLQKIDDLKARIAGSGLTARQLAPDMQTLYISVLRREIQSLEELRNLRRRRRKVDSGKDEGSGTGITVTGALHPPVLVEIGEVTESIQEPLSGVQLTMGGDRKIAVKKHQASGAKH